MVLGEEFRNRIAKFDVVRKYCKLELYPPLKEMAFAVEPDVIADFYIENLREFLKHYEDEDEAYIDAKMFLLWELLQSFSDEIAGYWRPPYEEQAEIYIAVCVAVIPDILGIFIEAPEEEALEKMRKEDYETYSVWAFSLAHSPESWRYVFEMLRSRRTCPPSTLYDKEDSELVLEFLAGL